jgi:3-oxoacyl-[acyl-carrier-protein] synthase II
MGIYCPIGKNVHEFQDALMQGTDGITRIERFSTSEFTAEYAAMFSPHDWHSLETKYPDYDHRIAMALEAAKEACAEVKLDQYSPERIGLVLGICLGKVSEEDRYPANKNDSDPASLLLLSKLQYQTYLVADHMGIKGPVIAISTACASSNHALGYACDLLKYDFLDAVLVGGTGEVTQAMFAGFYALGNMSDSPCAPFSIPVGLNLGEGAGFVVLERHQTDITHSASNIGSIAGFGTSSDTYHPTSPDPGGRGVARAISTALKDAGLQVGDIGYINAHGTGTHDNDQAEWLGIKKTFGKYSPKIPVSSSKSFMGHTGAAAGIVEAIITLICMNNELVPTTLHFTKPRRLVPENVVSAPKPQPHGYQNAINCNSGFGGSNAAVVLSKGIAASWEPALVTGIPVFGTGSISAYGIGNLKEALHGKKPYLSEVSTTIDGIEQPEYAGYIPTLDYSTFTKGRDERFLDPISRYMITASSLALRDSGVLLDEQLSDKTGIVTGVSHIPSQSTADFWNSIKERGLRGISSHAFSKVVMNASMGAVCEIHNIKGPSTTIAASEGAGLFAAAYACMCLTQNPDLALMFAIAADELGDTPLALHSYSGRSYLPSEGAGCVLFGHELENGTDPSIQVTGIGVAGAHYLSSAIRKALGRTHHDDIPAIFCADDGNPTNQELQKRALQDIWGESHPNLIILNPASAMGYADASTAMFSLILAIQALQEGELYIQSQNQRIAVSKLMVVSVNEINGSCAMLIENIFRDT